MASVQVRNVNRPGHRENLKEEKYSIIREAILSILPDGQDHKGITFDQLDEKVHEYLSSKNVPNSLFPKQGSVRWYTKAVQLDLEVREEIERVPEQKPLRFRKTTKS